MSGSPHRITKLRQQSLGHKRSSRRTSHHCHRPLGPIRIRIHLDKRWMGQLHHNQRQQCHRTLESDRRWLLSLQPTPIRPQLEFPMAILPKHVPTPIIHQRLHRPTLLHSKHLPRPPLYTRLHRIRRQLPMEQQRPPRPRQRLRDPQRTRRLRVQQRKLCNSTRWYPRPYAHVHLDRVHSVA